MATHHISAFSTHECTVPDNACAMRLDKYLSDYFTDYSRSFFKQLIDQSCVKVNGKESTKSGALVKAGDLISIDFSSLQPPTPQTIATCTHKVQILFEHNHFLIINKPTPLLIHKPTATSTEVTLVDWIMQNYHGICSVGATDRPGIVHRLDKNTSGALIIPRTNYAHATFGHMFKERTIQKTYYAVVEGHPDPSGTIATGIGRDPLCRSKMRAFKESELYLEQKHGIKIRTARTHYQVVEYFTNAALVEVKPVTGRTHQIRVHLASIGHPIVGDPVYNQRASKHINRQALHAHMLSFEFGDEPFTFKAPLPVDLLELITTLRLES